MKGELVKLLEDTFSNDEEVTEEMVQQVLGFSNDITSTLFDFINYELLYIKEDEEKRIPFKKACDYLYNAYHFLEYIIYHMRDLNKLSMVLKRNANMVNLRDENNVPLYFRVIQDYINAVTSKEFNEKDILYYSGVLLLLKNKSLHVTKKEKNRYLQRINEGIKKLDKWDKNYLDRKNRLSDFYQLVLGKKEDNMNHFDLLDKYHVNIFFSERIMGEMYKYTSNELDNRRIFVDEYTITIDKKSTKEIDDALTIKKLSNGNYLLGVHIANVLGYLPYYSEIVDNAIRSGRTIYLPNPEKSYLKDLITIFPLEFSSYSASLIQSERRLANSYFIELDREANVIDFYCLKTIIRNDAKCSYSYIDRILKKGSQNKKLMETVLLLDELTYKLEEKGPYHPGCTRSEAIVEITTRLVNSQIANFFYVNSYPFLYRVHEIEKNIDQDIEALKKIRSDPASLRLYKEFQNLYSTRFDTKGFHEKLNNIPYCHGTSPLRRGEDIVVEHCLDTCYFKTPLDKDLYLLEEDVKCKKDIINLAYDRIEILLTESHLLSQNQNQKVKNL